MRIFVAKKDFGTLGGPVLEGALFALEDEYSLPKPNDRFYDVYRGDWEQFFTELQAVIPNPARGPTVEDLTLYPPKSKKKGKKK
jgi:hypothetical protein